MPLQIGILASGTGSNAEAIADAIDAGRLDANIRLLVCNRPAAPVLLKAAARHIETSLIEHRGFSSRETFDSAVATALENAEVELVVMAGFDRIITPALISRYPDRILNIHPALLPAFPGANAQGQAFDYGVKIAGATVHIVDQKVDHGPIVIQAAVAVLPEDDVDALRRRILAVEHRIYPYAIQLFAQRRILVVGRKVVISAPEATGGGAGLDQPGSTKVKREPLNAYHRRIA